MVLDIYFSEMNKKLLVRVYHDFGIEDLDFNTQSAMLDYFEYLTDKGYTLRITMVGE